MNLWRLLARFLQEWCPASVEYHSCYATNSVKAVKECRDSAVSPILLVSLLWRQHFFGFRELLSFLITTFCRLTGVVSLWLMMQRCRYAAGTMPWGNPGSNMTNFEPQRLDDGYLEVIGFTAASLVCGCLFTLIHLYILIKFSHSTELSCRDNNQSISQSVYQSVLFFHLHKHRDPPSAHSKQDMQGPGARSYSSHSQRRRRRRFCIDN